MKITQMEHDPETALPVIAAGTTVIEDLPVWIDFRVSDYRSSEQCVLFFDLLCYLFAEMLVQCAWFIYRFLDS